MLSGSDIRQKFLSFFESKGHTIVPSASLIPSNDPTLMFTAAGMVPFKNVFTGDEKRAYTRATSSQRCVRAGGKHNDLENVGKTARHHTFFEMLGNFSFGDYFKESAIPFAWEFLTSDAYLGLDKSRLYITIYHTDEEAYNIWKAVWNEAGWTDEQIEQQNRIIRIATDDNFWSAGDTGPCGPCTEIFYDHGADIWGGLPGTPEEDGDRFIEIWNIVFMQYDRQADGEMRPLPQTGVDTGCGLERISAVLQHKHNNYETDFFMPIIEKSAELSGIPYTKDEETLTAYRVLSDHLRATAFLVVDGVMPSNEGRGYVLRRIMRRAMRFMHMVGINEPFMFKLVQTLVDMMGEQYPELVRAQKMVEDVIKTEEERFGKTLDKGLKILETETANLKKGDVLSGEIAFQLYDTYGFPLDVTQMVCEENGISVDEAGFEAAMAEQKAKARAAHKGTGDMKLAPVWFDVQEQHPTTEFVGYENTRMDADVIAIITDEGDLSSLASITENAQSVKQLHQNKEAWVVFSVTPFYAESGGQVGDTGEIRWTHEHALTGEGNNGHANVLDTQKILDGIFVHHVRMDEKTETPLCTGDSVRLIVDTQRRNDIKKNHSATHLMHAVLRETLGDHVFQKGSVVSEDRLRFDFSQPKALTAEQLATIERKVNEMIWAAKPVTTRLMNKEEAVEAGAMALFGEKYDDDVRVLFMGDDKDMLSVELCGGIHVNNTSEIGVFKISAESAISAGVRRIEAVTGQKAYEMFATSETQLKQTAAQIKAQPAELSTRVEAMQAEIKKLKQDVKNAQKCGGAGNSVADMVKNAEDINGTKFIAAALEGIDPAVLREMVDELKNALGSGVILLATNNEEKSSIVAGVTKDLVGKYKAGDIANAAAATLGGKGGGRPDMAMAGGKAGDLTAAINAGRSAL